MTAVLEAPTFPVVQAHKEKDRAPYTFTLGERHLKVLRKLVRHRKEGLTDAELVFGLQLHQAGARRCELRDVGAVRRAGRYKGSWRWKITDRGIELLSNLERQIGEQQ